MGDILFVNKQNGFTMVANKLLCATNLSLKAKGLYAYLMSKPNHWNFSTTRICKDMKEGRDSVNNIMNELEQVLILKRQKIKDDTNQWVGVAYYISDISNSNITHEFKKEERVTNGKPIEERKEHFRKESLLVYLNKPDMNKPLGKKFFEYWTEKTRGGKLMRFELQDTFEISLRMDKFIENKKEYEQSKIDRTDRKRKELQTKNT